MGSLDYCFARQVSGVPEGGGSDVAGTINIEYNFRARYRSRDAVRAKS